MCVCGLCAVCPEEKQTPREAEVEGLHAMLCVCEMKAEDVDDVFPVFNIRVEVHFQRRHHRESIASQSYS